MCKEFLATPFRNNPVAIVWGVFAALGLLCLVFATPPMQVPDESNHFLRIIQIGQGTIVGQRLNERDSGGYVPADAVLFNAYFSDIPFHPERKASWEKLAGASRFSWNSPQRLAGFPNTVIYAPVSYLPAAAGVDVGRLFHCSILTSFYLGRIFNAAFCWAIGLLALLTAKRARLLLAALISMPMVLFLFASCSQDGAIIAMSALCAALLTRLDDKLASHNRMFWPLIAVLVSCIAVSKPPYILVVFIPLVLASRALMGKAALVLVTALTVVAVWSVWGLHPAKVPFMVETGVDSGRQMRWSISHPLKTVTILYHTFQDFGRDLLQQFIGVLGWLDAPLPRVLYPCEYLLFLGLILFSAQSLNVRFSREAIMREVLLLVLLFGTFTGVSFALYLIWTPVGNDPILGIQGRYFIPLAIFAMLALPSRSDKGLFNGLRTRGIESTLLFVTMILDFFGTGYTVLLRYW